ncbi:hypothetical protein T01_2161 [Trichinella spiralis]|uniref:Uncharacterized protein n=1 Tax=Trichinella spiralis TaxID=6334 RepID=A0A0V1BWM8_TRISP|nr:hypothetical protein T01_2161 [Trichinella spiralis]
MPNIKLNTACNNNDDINTVEKKSFCTSISVYSYYSSFRNFLQRYLFSVTDTFCDILMHLYFCNENLCFQIIKIMHCLLLLVIPFKTKPIQHYIMNHCLYVHFGILKLSYTDHNQNATSQQDIEISSCELKHHLVKSK